MAGAQSQHRLALPSSSPPPSRSARRRSSRGCCPMNSWTILFWRGLFGGGLIAVIMVVLQGRAGLRDLVGMGRSGWLVALYSTLGDDRLHPLAAADQRIQCRDHHRNRTVPRRRTCLDMASRNPAIGGPCWRASWRSAASPSSSATRRMGSDILGIALACFMALAIAAMTVMVRRHKDTSMVAAAAISNFLDQCRQHPVRARHHRRHRRRPVHPGDVRVLSGRAGADAVLPRLAPVAVRPGRPDLDAGNAADAVLDLAGVCRGARACGFSSAAPW